MGPWPRQHNRDMITYFSKLPSCYLSLFVRGGAADGLGSVIVSSPMHYSITVLSSLDLQSMKKTVSGWIGNSWRGGERGDMSDESRVARLVIYRLSS